MAKAKRQYRCTSCGHLQATWVGICPSCQEAGTLEEVERRAERAGRRIRAGEVPAASFRPMSSLDPAQAERTTTGSEELDRVLGGGLVPGSYLCLFGEPGAGKSTLSSQLLIHLSAQEKVGYVSGEESEGQIKMRFDRLGGSGAGADIAVSTEVSVERICESISGEGFALIVIDSIQTLFSEDVAGAPGSVSQVRECAGKLMRAAKESGTSVLLVGHVTKGGDLAGPRMLEHAVDVVLAFEGDRREQHRILRTVKNRFGSTDEIAVFEMTAAGLIGVSDPSKLLASEETGAHPGSVTACIVEGSRPLLVEVQALVNPSNLAQPIRAVRGIDPRRAQMLIAVLQRKAHLRAGSLDIYVNVAGGIKVEDPAIDLAICLAIASAAEGRAPKEGLCAFGEVSLLGHVRAALQAERRRKEAERLGYASLEGPGSLAELVESGLGTSVEAPANEISVEA